MRGRCRGEDGSDGPAKELIANHGVGYLARDRLDAEDTPLGGMSLLQKLEKSSSLAPTVRTKLARLMAPHPLTPPCQPHCIVSAHSLKP